MALVLVSYVEFRREGCWRPYLIRARAVLAKAASGEGALKRTVSVCDLCTLAFELVRGVVDFLLRGVVGEADEVLLCCDGAGDSEDGCDGSELHFGVMFVFVIVICVVICG